jgi:excisionase family DNA binding protein
MASRYDSRPEAISVQRAAVLLDVSERTIRRWGKSGRLELVRVGPKLLRVPRDVLSQMRHQRAQVSAAPPPLHSAPPIPTGAAERLRQDVARLAQLLADDDHRPADHGKRQPATNSFLELR